MTSHTPTYFTPSSGEHTHLVNVIPTSLFELQMRKEGNDKERPILYLPGCLATFITLYPVAGINRCLFYDVVHDDGWFVGNDTGGERVRQDVPNCLHLSLNWRHKTINQPQKGVDPTRTNESLFLSRSVSNPYNPHFRHLPHRPPLTADQSSP